MMDVLSKLMIINKIFRNYVLLMMIFLRILILKNKINLKFLNNKVNNRLKYNKIANLSNLN